MSKLIDNVTKNIATPFLRWTGSKNWLVKEGLLRYLPTSYKNYHECFLGGGAVYFNLSPKNETYLYDLNEELVETYIQIRDNVNQVIESLKRLKNTENNYYHIRKSKPREPHNRAARFIYLNRCSFNGIYRVNPQGHYNVPYGRRKNVDIVTKDNLIKVSKSLENATITASDFELSLSNIQKEDLVFLDPPYTIAHENNGFLEYNSKLFSWKDQERLRNFIKRIDELGAYFILSNAEHSSIRELYRGVGEIHSTSRYSKVGGRNKTRGVFSEVIITNIDNSDG